MFMRTIWSTLILSGVAASAIALAQSADQADDSDKQPQAAEATSELARAARLLAEDQVRSTPVPVPATIGGFAPYHGMHPASTIYGVRPLSPEEQRQAKEFRERVETLRRAKSDEEKTAAREQLNEMVAAQLERDLQERETKLAEIEARAKDLRDQLEQRRSSKAEIQKMLMLMIESPETGLGLPPAWMNSLMQPGITAVPAYAGSYVRGFTATEGLPQATSPRSNSPAGPTILPPAPAK